MSHLAVRTGLRFVFLSLARVEFLVVVNLPICCDRDVPVLAREGLGPTVRVHDGQALMRHATEGLPVGGGEHVVP